MKTYKVAWTEYYVKTVEARDAEEAEFIALDNSMASDYIDCDIVEIKEIKK